MPDPDLRLMTRAVRPIPVAHGEALQLMLYSSKCGLTLWVWNSRDGVTPFGMSIDGVAYQHAMNSYRPSYTAVIPAEASHVFVSYDRAAWEAMQRETYERFAARPDDEPNGGAEFRGRWPTVEAWLQITPFEHGQPRLMTRADFLASTPEWFGKCA